MRRYIYIIGVAVALLTAGCGQRHRAENAVEEFISQNLRDASLLGSCHFSAYDSTRQVSDSAVQAMHRAASASRLFRSDIRYAGRSGRLLLLTRATYLLDGDTCGATFYLNPSADGVVAFKEN